MINDIDIRKIDALLMQMLVVGNASVQFYDPADEFRTRYTIKTNNAVYANVPMGKMNKWHFSIFDKKKKNIPLKPFMEDYPEHNITRIGFRK